MKKSFSKTLQTCDPFLTHALRFFTCLPNRFVNNTAHSVTLIRVKSFEAVYWNILISEFLIWLSVLLLAYVSLSNTVLCGSFCSFIKHTSQSIHEKTEIYTFNQQVCLFKIQLHLSMICFSFVVFLFLLSL